MIFAIGPPSGRGSDRGSRPRGQSGCVGFTRKQDRGRVGRRWEAVSGDGVCGHEEGEVWVWVEVGGGLIESA